MATVLEKRNTSELAEGLVKEINLRSLPNSKQVQLIKSGKRCLLFVVNGSRLIEISKEIGQKFESLLIDQDEAGIQKTLEELSLDNIPYVDDDPLISPKVHALSLAIAQKCNMGCTYCYADQGGFGGPSKNMSFDVAKKSIDLLLENCEAHAKAQLTFLGGEPLVNRTVMRQSVEYSSKQALEKNITLNFSITTNGTLLTEDDAHFFEQYGFAVTISLDGLAEDHDGLRPMKNGSKSFNRIMRNIVPLLRIQKKMQVAARVTVTPLNVKLSAALDKFFAMGFHSVGFSPLLNSSSGTHEMDEIALDEMLVEMVSCGLQFELSNMTGSRYPFLNLVNSIKEISKGTHRPYPCGAGAGYLGVSADGELAACHRFVNDDTGRMGNVTKGIDADLQNEWLAKRHVHTQEPCKSCWARYLCGGGCHHEVIHKGRKSCDYIRGWLYYSIQAYDRMLRMAPEYFS